MDSWRFGGEKLQAAPEMRSREYDKLLKTKKMYVIELGFAFKLAVAC